MAHYLVTVLPKQEKMSEIEENIRKGVYESMRPFGQTLANSLRNAKIREDGRAVWEEEDYCSPPLDQERRAVLDEYFDEIAVEPVAEGEGWKRIEKLPGLFQEF